MRTVFAVLVLVLLITTVIWTAYERGRPPLLGELRLGTVKRVLIHNVASIRATASPKRVIEVSAPVEGELENVFVHVGDRVVRGQVIASFNTDLIDSELRARQRSLVEAITQLQSAKKQFEVSSALENKALADIRKSIGSLSRAADFYDNLLPEGSSASVDADEIHGELEHYRALLASQTKASVRQQRLQLARLPALKAKVDILEAELQERSAQLDPTVRAPATGTIIALNMRAGARKRGGDHLATIASPADVMLLASFPEALFPRTHTGQLGQVHFDGKPYPVVVSSLSNPGGEAFTVQLSFRGAPPRSLSLGARLVGDLTLGPDFWLVSLPRGPYLQASGGHYVFVIDQRMARIRAVRLSQWSDRDMEVKTGLRPGERVILSDYRSLISACRKTMPALFGADSCLVPVPRNRTG